jgi:arginine:pyruvate transaminase
LRSAGAVLFWPRHLGHANLSTGDPMPQPSHRIRALLGGEEDGWAVFLKARRMIAAGVPVLELTIGEHDVGTDAAILDEMHRAARAGHTGYAAVPGIPALRARIAERLGAASGVPMASTTCW